MGRRDGAKGWGNVTNRASSDAPRVLHVVASGGDGGAQRHIEALTAGHSGESALLAGSDGWLVRRFSERGGTCVVLPPLAWGAPAGWGGVRRALPFAPDLVHAHGVKAALWAKAASGLGAVVYTSHGFAFASPTHALPVRSALRLAERWRLGRLAAFIGVSAEECRLSRDLGMDPGRIFHIPNGAEPSGAARPPRPVLRVGALGRFVPEKGFDRLIPLARQLPAGVHMVIAGDGPLRRELERSADRHGVREKVEFVGWQADSRAFLATLDLFVLPSRKEGLPLALLEAMAEGLPVVAYAVGGVADAVQPGISGQLVAPGDEESFCRRVLELCARPELGQRMGKAARQRIESAFSVDRMVADTARVYRHVREEGVRWKA